MYMYRVYQQFPNLLAEMYAFSMAAAHEQLPHTLMRHLMVSNPIINKEEYWPYIDTLGDDIVAASAPIHTLADGLNYNTFYPTLPMPVLIHFCGLYHIGEYGFEKRRVPEGLFTCEGPLFVDLPVNISHLRYKLTDGGPGGRVEVGRFIYILYAYSHNSLIHTLTMCLYVCIEN